MPKLQLNGARPMSSWAKRRAQNRLRKALLAGDATEALQCLRAPAQQEGKPRTSWRMLQSVVDALTAGMSSPASAQLDFCHEDDLGATPVAYLATGSRILDAKPVPCQRSSTPTVVALMYSAWLGPGVATQAPDAQEARAEMLRLFLAAGHQPNLSAVTHRADGLLHCCLLNGGNLPVLAVLLQGLPRNYPPSLKPR